MEATDCVGCLFALKSETSCGKAIQTAVPSDNLCPLLGAEGEDQVIQD